jgi:hypothetical protein
MPTTPFDKVVRNDLDRFRHVIDVIARGPDPRRSTVDAAWTWPTEP